LVNQRMDHSYRRAREQNWISREKRGERQQKEKEKRWMV